MSSVATVVAPSQTAVSRLVGIDLARALAMLGMVIAHYAWPDQSGSSLNVVPETVDGRSMPLFVLLGGVGVTLLTRRAEHPDRTLLIRAAVLYPLGLALQEATTFIAIILQSYGLLFAMAPLLRRLSNRTLATAAVIVGLAGGWTYQVLAPTLDRFEGPTDLITNPPAALWSLLFNGYYPFVPVAAFFMLGLLLGRLDLRSVAVQRALTVSGAVVGLGTMIVANRLIDPASVPTGPRLAESSFSWDRLLDTGGHSEMPAWVISAAGTSTAVLGLSLLLAPLLATALRPMVALGQLALSFYVFQAVLVRVTPHPDTTPLSQELVTAAIIYIGFAVFAVIWQLRFRNGPLEAALRLASGPHRPRPVR